MLLPPGKRRSFYDGKIIAAYLAGTSSGALVTTLVAWTCSGFSEPLSAGLRAVLLAGGAVLVWLCKQGPLSRVISLPEARRQIPATVFGGSLVRGAYRFGFEMGTGARTYVPSAAPYVLLLALLFLRLTVGEAVLVGLGFGLGRTVPLIAQVLAASRLRFAPELLRGTDPATATLATLFVFIGAISLV